MHVMWSFPWAGLFHASLFSYQKRVSILFLRLHARETQSGTDHSEMKFFKKTPDRKTTRPIPRNVIHTYLTRVRHPSVDWSMPYHVIELCLVIALSTVLYETTGYPRSQEVEFCPGVLYEPMMRVWLIFQVHLSQSIVIFPNLIHPSSFMFFFFLICSFLIPHYWFSFLVNYYF